MSPTGSRVVWVLLCFLVGVHVCCAEAAAECAPDEFKCLKGECTKAEYLCDGFNNCEDGSDEKVCNPYNCHSLTFQCLNGKCVSRRRICNNIDDCRDNSDEKYCDLASSTECPPGYSRCPYRTKCIPSDWVCDGIDDCYIFNDRYLSEETGCETYKTAVSTNTSSKSADGGAAELKSWLVGRRRADSGRDRWGQQVHRIAVALHLVDESTFSPGNRTGEELRYELTIQLLHRRSKDKKMSSQELALFVHALLVSCLDPGDFYGDDLVRELRGRVEASGNYTNPFLILVLCNAGDAMTARDVNRVTAAYDSQHRPFWTDYQALASMALSCISSSPRGAFVDERVLKEMLQELKRRQFRNGTVDNLRTTALVTQALFINDANKKDFDLDSAIKVLTDGLDENKSILDAYYTLPVLHQKSLLNVSSSHCRKQPIAEEEGLQRALEVSGETMTVHYSVWMGEEINVGRTWRLRVRVNSTVYDAIETVAKIDHRQRVVYNVVEGKPYVATLNGKEEDPEMATFWFLYLKSPNSDKDPKMIEESPVDVKLQPNQEIILWYKLALWSSQSVTST